MKQPAVYIITNKQNGTLYTGVTSNLVQRIFQHKNHSIDGFAKKYNCSLLIFYELHETMEYAILREKQIKKYSRKRKLQLIENINPDWLDLYQTIS